MTEYLIYAEDGRYLGGTSVMEQAVGAAQAFAAKGGRPIDVVQVSSARSGTRRVRYNPDGTKEKLWKKEGQADGG
jgi:hypothetical protein